jgi:Domain of unknown function (DUF4397)
MKRYLAFIAGLMIVVCIASCEKDAKLPATLPVSQLMVYNGSADYFGASSMILINNRFYGSRSYNDNGAGLVGAYNFSKYSFIDTGLYRIAFTDTTQVLENAKKISESLFKLEDKKHYTIYLLDSLGFYATMYTQDDEDSDPLNAKIRMINLSPDAGTIYLRIDTMSIAGIKNVSYKQVTAYTTVKQNIKPGIRIMYFDKTGREQLLIRKSFPLEAGKCYTMILRGYRQPADGNVNKTINLSTITNF